jgi:hypothetical protein
MTTILHTFGDLVRELMLQVPLPVVRAVFLAVPVVLLIWVLRLPRAETTPEAPTGRFGENLKLGVAVALLLQVLIYSLF